MTLRSGTWIVALLGFVQAVPASALTYEELTAAMERQKRVTWIAQPAKPRVGGKGIPMVAGAAEEDEAAPRLFNELVTAEGLTAGPAEADLPAAFDWRNRGGLNYMSATTLAQGECGACVSFAAIATLEAALNIACDSPGRTFDLSRQHFFSCGGGSCKSGWKLSEAMNTLVERGVPDTPCMPYLASAGDDIDCAAGCQDSDDRAIRGMQYERITTGFIDINKIKRALLRGPLVANMILFEDLEFYKGGVYRHVDGQQLGSHAIVLIGWDDAQKAWIARNSWGAGWGDSGYFMVAWDDASLPGRYTWLLDVGQARLSGICTLPR